MAFVGVHAGYGCGGRMLASFELHKVSGCGVICWTSAVVAAAFAAAVADGIVADAVGGCCG